MKSYLLFIAALAVGSAHASTLTLTGLESFIRSNATLQDTDQSSNESILIGEVSTADEMRGVFSFALTDPLLTGATINSISLVLVGRRSDDSVDADVTLGLHEVSTPFTSSVDWNHATHDTASWTTAGGDFGAVLATVTDNPSTFAADDVHTFSSAALTAAGAANVGGTFRLLAQNQSVDDDRSIFFYHANDEGGEEVRPRLIIDYTPASTSDLEIRGFSYNPVDGSSQVSIKGAPGGRYKLVEAADLDFSTPDLDPVPLTSPAIVGTLDGNVVICNAEGNATVGFNLGTSEVATFIRAEESP